MRGITLSIRRSMQKKPSSKSSATTSENRTSTSGASNPISGSNQDRLMNGIGPYQFIRPLGNGKFSRVMYAKHNESGKEVAIKIIDKQAHDYRVMSRLVREIDLMELLDHPNIVRLHETFETCDSLFLVMEYVPGMNLDEYLHSKGGRLSEDEARSLFRQLTTAVSFCHSRWVVHRDLKTPNVMVTPDGVVKLADFGLGNRFGLQRLRTICGSMLYYSPEIITGQKYYGPEVDCWCLGIALFRMTAGFEPFSHAHTVGQLKKDVCSCNFPMPDHLSKDLQSTIQKCLQIDRRKRITVRQALRDDPWLTQSGQLPCPISDMPKTVYDETVGDNEERERRARHQFMREQQQQNDAPRATVKRTIIYHPINPSTYFTTHQQNVELLRSELLRSICGRARHLGIRTAEKWETLALLRSSFRLTKKNATMTTTTITPPTTTPTSSPALPRLAQVMQRLTRDQVFYFHVHGNNNSNNNNNSSSHSGDSPRRPTSELPSLSSSQSTSSFSFSSQEENHDDTTIESQVFAYDLDRNGRHIMDLLKKTCQLMGISYVHETPSQLACVLTLRDGRKTSDKTNPQQQQSSSQQQSIQRRTSRSSSQTTAKTHLTNNEDIVLMEKEPIQRSSRRLSLPLISQLTSSMTTSFFGRTKQRHSLDERPADQNQEARNKKKDGVAVFTIELIVHKRSVSSQLVGLRFSKQQGSNTVFKMACGWVAGVMGLDGRVSQ
ncbi:hypothetical protein EC973_005607 [Apophysomyces ossiformis]|uniref:Protein kinase domain-containing protein n=1 Tax=Apophysomyces ossiformis TaxID=679940 RepID=A0A8H7ERI1_9FUNG|nr:hypothetical protein EC973_005607 [Apophysomyces ossiformis]